MIKDKWQWQRLLSRTSITNWHPWPPVVRHDVDGLSFETRYASFQYTRLLMLELGEAISNV